MRLVNRGMRPTGIYRMSDRLDLSRGSSRLPVVGQQFVQSDEWVCRNTREHVVEPGKRLDIAAFARSNEAAQDRRCLAAGVAAKKGPVAAAP